MEEKIATDKKQGFWLFQSKKMFVIALIAAILVFMLCILTACAAAVLSSDRIYDGVYIEDFSVGSMTKEEAKNAVLEHFQIEQSENLTLACGAEERTLPISALEAELDPETMVNEAYELGRSGSIFERLGCILEMKGTPRVVSLSVKLNEEILAESIHSIAAVCDEPEQENQFEITETELIVTRGHSGKRIVLEDAIQSVKKHLFAKENPRLELSLVPISPAVINADYIATEICGDPIDATYQVEDYKLVISDEKIGVTMDLEEAERCIKQAEGDTIRIPITTKMPEKTAKELNESLFSDLLGSYSTKYNAGDTNRSYNISLAGSSINEIVLAPGDIFSYNDIVGPRTTARGYRMAHVYVNNRTTDGIGGGICQVSSTLYNAVVLADLEIVSRKNHSLPVSYVPMGRDATVSYGSIDFKFKNNTEAPIKLSVVTGGGKITISIYGNKLHPNRSVSITSERTAYIPAPLEQREDPTLPVGTVKVEEKGSNGSTYQTYKIISENGTVISREHLATSKYNAASRIEIIGTMPIESSEELNAPTNGQAPTENGEAVQPDVPSETEEPGQSETPSATDTPAISPMNPAA